MNEEQSRLATRETWEGSPEEYYKRRTKAPVPKNGGCTGEEMAEEWKPIKGHPEYEISTHGRVKTNRRRKRIMRTQTAKDGHQFILLRKQARWVHRLVAIHFMGEIPIGFVVAHCDGNPKNNFVGNLTFATLRENQAHRLIHGTALRENGKFIANGRATA